MLAAIANRRVIPHGWQNDLLLAATVSFCATLPQATFAEFSIAEGPLREICTPRLTLDVRRGEHGARLLPGLGVVPDPSTVAQLRVSC